MANAKLSYPYEKFMNAVGSMTTSEFPLRKRISSAALQFIVLRPSDLPEGDIRDSFEGLMAKLTSVQDDSKGSIQASLDAMTDTQVRGIADDIFSLFIDIVREYF